MPINYKLLFGAGATAAALAVDKLLPSWPDWIGIALALVAVACYALGSWEWSGKFQAIEQSNRRRNTRSLRCVVTASVLISGLLLIFIMLKLIPTAPLDTSQIAMLERYRRFYENSEAPHKTTLIEMTNGELKTRGGNLYIGIKAMNTHWSKVARERDARAGRKEIDQIESGRLWREEMAQAGLEFDAKYRVEARMVLQELRNRIPHDLRKHIIGLGNINPADVRSGKVSLYDLFPADFAVGFSDLLAREIEELVRLLPPD